MSRDKSVLVLVFLMLTMSFAGCLGDQNISSAQPVEDLQVQDNPCSKPTTSDTQSVYSLTVNGEEREFRLSIPSSDAGTKLALIVAYHGGGGAEEDFEQQRGQKENSKGETNDVRALQEKGKVEPIDKPAEVKKQENKDSGTTESFFYGDR